VGDAGAVGHGDYPAAAGEFARLRRVEVLSPARKRASGRLIFTVNALPTVRPMNFVLVDGLIVLCTTAQSTATRKIDHAIVAFEADELDVANCSGWSVIMTGRAEVVKDAEMTTRYRAVPLVPRAPGVRDQFATITTELVEGPAGTRRHWDRACPGLTPVQLLAYTRGGRFVRDTIGSPIQNC
jgi:uncharacterized protein